MNVYKTKAEIIRGTTLKDVLQRAKLAYAKVSGRTKRRPYIRSAYFDKEKIFFDYFWLHINQKSRPERRRRLIFLSCATELIEKSRLKPEVTKNPNKREEVLYRFTGKTPTGEEFAVQIKEDQKSRHKYLMSIFPLK